MRRRRSRRTSSSSAFRGSESKVSGSFDETLFLVTGALVFATGA